MCRSLGFSMVVGSALIWHSQANEQTGLLHVFLGVYIFIGIVLLIKGIKPEKRIYHGYKSS